MERVAEWAGVSKALPYAHFDNSDDMLVALYQRVVGTLGDRIITALESAATDDDLVAVLVEAYLDTVVDLGPVLGAVTAPGSLTVELADDGRRVGPQFAARVLRDHFGVPADRARAAAPVILAALTGAVRAWADGEADRDAATEMSTAVLRALI